MVREQRVYLGHACFGFIGLPDPWSGSCRGPGEIGVGSDCRRAHHHAHNHGHLEWELRLWRIEIGRDLVAVCSCCVEPCPCGCVRVAVGCCVPVHVVGNNLGVEFFAVVEDDAFADGEHPGICVG